MPLSPLSPRFSSTIRMVTHAEFDAAVPHRDRLRADGQYAGWGDDTEDDFIGKRVGYHSRAGTEGAYDCNAAGIIGGNMVTMYHLHPLGFKKFPQALEDALKSDIAGLKRYAKEALRGFITGGRAFQDNDRYEPSFKLFRTLRHLMHREGVKDISVIWGRRSPQDNGPLDLFYDTKNDTWLVHTRSNKLADVVTLDDLKTTFRYIRIAKGDTLVVQDRDPIPGPFVAGFHQDPPPIVVATPVSTQVSAGA